jgi:O-antigen/teichoic acid export membrane protein
MGQISYLKKRLENFSAHKTVTSIATVFAGSSISRVIGFFTAWFLVRHLTPQDYGIFSVLDTVSGISAGLLTSGLNWAMLKSIAASQDNLEHAWYVARKVLKIELVYGIILATGIFVGADALAQHLFRKPELSFYLRLCSIGAIGTILLGFRSGIYQGFKYFRQDALFAVLQASVYLAVVIVLLFCGLLNIRHLAVFYIVVPLLVSLYAVALLKNEFKKGKHVTISKFFRTMSRDYIWLLVYSLCLWFAVQINLLALTRYFPMKEVGLYGFAFKIYGIALMLTNSINVVLLPTFAGITDRQALREIFLRVLKGTTGVSLGFLVTIPFLGLFIKFFAGPHYLGATGMLQILMFGAATSTILSPPVNVLFALNKYKFIAVGGILLAIVSAIGNLTLTKNYGGIGAASVQTLSFFILNLYCSLVAFKQFK